MNNKLALSLKPDCCIYSGNDERVISTDLKYGYNLEATAAVINNMLLSLCGVSNEDADFSKTDGFMDFVAKLPKLVRKYGHLPPLDLEEAICDEYEEIFSLCTSFGIPPTNLVSAFVCNVPQIYMNTRWGQCINWHANFRVMGTAPWDGIQPYLDSELAQNMLDNYIYLGGKDAIMRKRGLIDMFSSIMIRVMFGEQTSLKLPNASEWGHYYTVDENLDIEAKDFIYERWQSFWLVNFIDVLQCMHSCNCLNDPHNDYQLPSIISHIIWKYTGDDISKDPTTHPNFNELYQYLTLLQTIRSLDTLIARFPLHTAKRNLILSMFEETLKP